jgi:HD-like signal output (HDOD) protein
MLDRRILTSLLEVQDLPTLPEVVSRIIETVEDESSSAQDLTLLLEQDHAISARVLRLANSAFYGLGQRVESIRRAVVVLGFDAVRQLALATSVFNTLAQRRQFALDPEDFWMHSFGAAKAAQLIATRQRAKLAENTTSECCFTAALLHDIGKYLLALVLEDEYTQITAAAKEEGCSLREIEMPRLNANHAVVGAWLMNRWDFPPMFIEVTASQYRLANYTGRFRQPLEIVSLAGNVARAAGFGNAGDWDEPAFEARAFTELQLENADLDAIRDEMKEVLQETRQFLSIMKEK